ncbi:MAG: outer membrane protein assembly factor BamE, partial [Acetobacteraceae bacterium]|nr:outer membrane protein assembly factor BamE [Acetobacteraceae bacterium]
MLHPPPAVRGNKVTPDELGQLVAGKTTQAQATDILASPTAKGTFDPNNRYYISETTRPVIAGTQGV